ncbi:LysR substrate-binding domain-containing protein [Deinococcus altitudinis]|uniref:LysR substrate-binding domain-containing protein n=1 Tax=Deinococcus altitudinis TaxID=468914 RepID=UPI003891E220
MEHRLLRYFVAVAEELHFGRAAERLHLAQQPLSAAIKRLETQLGVQLLKRTSRRVALTDAGQVYLDAAREILRRTLEAGEAARRVAQSGREELFVGYKSGALYSVLPEVVRQFRQQHPAAELHLRELEFSRVEAALSAQEVQVGLLCPGLRNPALASERVLRELMVLVLPLDHPMAQLDRVPLGELQGETLICCHRPLDAPAYYLEVYDAIREMCRASGFTPSSIQEVASEDAVASLVAAGLGIGLVSASFASTTGARLEVRLLDGPGVEVDLLVAWHREDGSPLTTAFVNLVREVGRQLMDRDSDPDLSIIST